MDFFDSFQNAAKAAFKNRGKYIVDYNFSQSTKLFMSKTIVKI